MSCCALERSVSHRVACSSGTQALSRALASSSRLAYVNCALPAPVKAGKGLKPVAAPGPSLQLRSSSSSNGVSGSRLRYRFASSAAAVDAEAPSATEPTAGTSASDLVTTIHSPEELDAQLKDHATQLVVLMCKAKGCRPCKAFGRKYSRFAQQFNDTIFLEIFGDESTDTRKLMIDMQIKSTPTFRYYRNGEVLGSHTGISEEKLRAAVLANLKEGEAGFGDSAEE